MKTYQKTVITVAVISTTLVGCASTPAPQAVVVATPAPIAATAPLAAPPATVAANIPAWFVNQPESTSEAVYVAGTGISRDLSMSSSKARLDAETRLATKLAGEISTMTKDYKREAGDEFSQSTEIVANKIAADVKLIGAVVVNRQIIAEGGGFRTYVLLKYPTGNNNKMLQNYFNRKSFSSSRTAAEAEMTQRAEEIRQRDAAAATVDPVAVVTTKVIPVKPNSSGIVIKETPATEDKNPLGLNKHNDAQEEN